MQYSHSRKHRTANSGTIFPSKSSSFTDCCYICLTRRTLAVTWACRVHSIRCGCIECTVRGKEVGHGRALLSRCVHFYFGPQALSLCRSVSLLRCHSVSRSFFQSVSSQRRTLTTSLLTRTNCPAWPLSRVQRVVAAAVQRAQASGFALKFKQGTYEAIALRSRRMRETQLFLANSDLSRVHCLPCCGNRHSRSGLQETRGRQPIPNSICCHPHVCTTEEILFLWCAPS